MSKYSRTTEAAPVLPEGYTKNLKAVAATRVILGGYRLTDLIGEVLKNY
jgi:hypothetical protein